MCVFPFALGPLPLPEEHGELRIARWTPKEGEGKAGQSGYSTAKLSRGQPVPRYVSKWVWDGQSCAVCRGLDRPALGCVSEHTRDKKSCLAGPDPEKPTPRLHEEAKLRPADLSRRVQPGLVDPRCCALKKRFPFVPPRFRGGLPHSVIVAVVKW